MALSVVYFGGAIGQVMGSSHSKDLRVIIVTRLSLGGEVKHLRRLPITSILVP
jgi:hypothetical protein